MSAANEPTPTVTLRPMRQHDIDAGLHLCRASGWNQVRGDWEWFLALAPGGMWVAELDAAVVGTVAAVRYGDRFGWIGMVLVDPAVRGRGIGTRLLDHAVALLSDLPAIGLDATPAGYPLYLARQFTVQARITRMRGVAPVADAEPAGVRPLVESDLDRVATLDARIFGADRSAMLRWLWQGAPEFAWVAQGHGDSLGYSFGRHGHDFDHLGPVIAVDVDMARGLLAASANAHDGRSVVVDAPSGDPAWPTTLESLGFHPLRPLLRMSRGHARVPGDLTRQFAILGPEFG